MSEYAVMPKEDYDAACNAIRTKTGKTEAIKSGDLESEILGITTGGGSFEDVRYVTFMNHDGTVEYGRKAVAVGDDCADPIARGLFDTPTRESDAQYNYTFYGWAREPNGGANANWNKAITENKTVYANFTATVRYYTITYYDGTTVLKTESLAYGSMPSYIAEKDGYGFGGWTPELTTVTGNASYTAVWVEKITFANASWADIARISEAGEAAKHFAIGDTKTIDFIAHNGTTYQAVLQIADFAHDPLASDDTVMAGMTIDCKMTYSLTTKWTDSTYATITPTNSAWIVDDFLATVKTKLPSELQSVIKPVKKTVRKYVTEYWDQLVMELFPYSSVEVGYNYQTELGKQYPIFSDDNSRIATNLVSGDPVSYFLRDFGFSSSDTKVNPNYIDTLGKKCSLGTTGHNTRPHRVRFGFCV